MREEVDLITAAKGALKMLQNDRDAFVVRAMRVNGTFTENDIRKRNQYDEVLDNLQKAIEASEDPVGWCVFDNTNIPVYVCSWESACHEHINEEIEEYDNVDAAKWKVRPIALHQSARSLQGTHGSSRVRERR